LATREERAHIGHDVAGGDALGVERRRQELTRDRTCGDASRQRARAVEDLGGGWRTVDTRRWESPVRRWRGESVDAAGRSGRN
jgi:hypothetical protein